MSADRRGRADDEIAFDRTTGVEDGDCSGEHRERHRRDRSVQQREQRGRRPRREARRCAPGWPLTGTEVAARELGCRSVDWHWNDGSFGVAVLVGQSEWCGRRSNGTWLSPRSRRSGSWGRREHRGESERCGSPRAGPTRTVVALVGGARSSDRLDLDRAPAALPIGRQPIGWSSRLAFGGLHYVVVGRRGTARGVSTAAVGIVQRTCAPRLLG